MNEPTRRTWAIGIVALMTVLAGADSPRRNNSTQKFPLTPDKGPWMIMAASFYGDDNEREAEQLADELRREFDVPVYTFGMQSQFGKLGPTDHGPFGSVQEGRYREFYEVAVLVGEFESIDHPRAQRLLQSIKAYNPKSLRDVSWRIPKNGKAKGPLWRAFLTRNPLMPNEQAQPAKLDPFVVELNSEINSELGNDLSLLECPGRYTVLVATFSGMVVYNPATFEEFSENFAKYSKLEQAAVEAHQLSQALRKMGYESYVFHDRSKSVVTVGSFGTLTDPRLKRHLEIFSPDREGPNAGKPKRLERWQFNAIAIPIFVPRP